MIGAVIGDIAGSRFEWHNRKSKDFTIFHKDSHYTDDSVMTLALAQALLDYKGKGGSISKLAIKNMRLYGKKYPKAGYGGGFRKWLNSPAPAPYNSYGNGAAMRVSSVGYVGETIKDVKAISKAVTSVTHSHIEGIKGAEATSVAIYMARTGSPMKDIRAAIQKDYYKLDFAIDDIRDSYKYDSSCQGTVPQAIEAFLESESFEDAIRIAVSVGGDSDTLAAITGGIAEAYYGVPTDMREKALTYLTHELRYIVESFEKLYPPKGLAAQ